MNPQRSASVGALPRERKHFVSRTESSSGASLDVRCACQYFESDSLLPERINPVDSRPSSKLGFHSEIDDWQGNVQHASAYPDQQHLQQSFHPMNLDAPSYQADNLSTRSFNAADTREDHPCAPMRSLGGQRSLDQASSPAAVDLTFVKKYPELEEAVRSRGLVVRSISGEPSVPGFGTFMAGHRRRQLSVGGLSAGSGMRDPDTISVRSVTSLRRISRSPSKGDLFVADINIPTTHADRREQHSDSGSHRTSNVDLSHFASHQKTQITTVVEPRQPQKQEQHPEAQTSPPQLNLITPTPSPGDNNLPPDFQRVTMLQTIEAQATSMQDYRVAKPPISTDYMRPTQNDDALKRSHQGGSLHPLQPANVSKSPTCQKKVLPQNQPIDVSKYAEYVEPSTIEEDVSLLLPQHRPIDVSKCGEKAAIEEQLAQMSPAPITVADRLQQEVTALEEANATRSIIEICDKIQSESYRPPSLAEDVSVLPDLHLDEQTQIDIESSLPVVDINELVRNEENKASQVRQKSPPRSITPQNKAPQTLQRMDTLQLPDTRTHSRDIRNQTQGYLKRQHTPESETPSESHKRSMIQSQPHPTVPHAVTSPDTISFENTSNEAKPTYASRFMSMFKTKTYEQEALPGRQMELSPKREKTPSPKREKTPSPKREKTPSPKREMTPSPKIGRSASPSRVKSMLIRNKPMAIEIVSGANAVITKKPEAEPHAVKVTETFSLKVDDMDQYNAHPAKIPSVAPSITTPPLSMFSSRENFRGSGKISVDFSEAFTPVVFAPSNRDQFLAGNRSFYSSDIDMQTQQSESEVHGMPPTMVNGSKAALVSVPIFVGDNKELGHASISEGSQKFLPRAPSEQRFQSKMMPTSAFIEGRTQSQDRARTASSTEDIYGSRITKTVSFNFGERKSRLSEFENENVSQQTRNQKDFLERTYFARDHEYEPIGEPVLEPKSPTEGTPVEREPTPVPSSSQTHEQSQETEQSKDIEEPRDEMKEAEELQKELEARYFTSEITTPPRPESRADNEDTTTQIDSNQFAEELPLKPENRRRSFMETAQDRTRKMQAGLKTQATKIKTKLRSPTKKPPSGSPKAKERRRFKAPEFSKIKMPELKRPDMSKLKDFKRPEFTKFSKPDMSKFKLPEKLTTLKLRRSKSFKENEEVPDEMSGVSPQSGAPAEATTQKKMFEFNFGTYPRAFRKKKKPLEPELSVETGTGPSVIPSTATQPSMESSSSPQGDRGPGPVRSRWADKFSDVSYNDSEGSRYRRYGSEQESFDRESSLERRMREDLEEPPSEDADLSILGGVTDSKQFAEFDEENRAIHKISDLRAGEFRRRPMVHQDSDLVSEESKDAVGWTDKEIQKNRLLHKAELDAESSYINYPSGDRNTQETQSTASSGKKVVLEEIDDDEFFLRKRGVSEDNIELRQYISSAIREGFDTPLNALEHVGQTSEPPEYGDYDVPPPKPRRLNKSYQSEDVSQEFETQNSQYGDDLSVSQTGSDFFGAPKPPMRKRRSRSKYSIDSHDMALPDTHRQPQYFDDDEEYLRPPGVATKEDDGGITTLNFTQKEAEHVKSEDVPFQPEAPRRRKRHGQSESSMDKDSYVNGFGGRSVSNSFLQPPEDVIVYRTEHEYHRIPLATPENYTDGTSTASRKSQSTSRFEDDDRIYRGAESLGLEHLTQNEMNELSAEEIQTMVEDADREKFMIDMMESDGYAVVRKEHLPKPTPPARRKKFSRSSGERFATFPHMRAKRSSPVPPERPPPPRDYSSVEPIRPRRKSALSLEESQNIEDEYEELQQLDFERAESPRNLQSGDIINKMKYRPLPPPPRPPRDKRQRSVAGKGLRQDHLQDEESNVEDRDGGNDRIISSSIYDSYDRDGDSDWTDTKFVEVEVSTQTDPLPDDFVCEEFEITPDMKIIVPRRPAKTLQEILAEEHPELERTEALTEDEQLARGLQRFREANQRSLSEKSRASSQADRSKSQSRPQTPSAIVIERRVATPIPSRETTESLLEAALIVRPIDDLDIEEEALRREGLLTDSSQHSKSDLEIRYQEDELRATSDYSQEPSSVDLEEAIEGLRSQMESERETEDDKEVELTMQSTRTDVTDGAKVKETGFTEELAETRKPHIPRIELTPSPTLQKDIHEDSTAEVTDDPIKCKHEPKLSFSRVPVEEIERGEREEIASESPQEPPQPPPRRHSSTTMEPSSLLLVQQPPMTQDIAPQLSVAAQLGLAEHMTIADLEVERLRVHALQAGKIMVSQLHGVQISSDELECKSGNLVVKNIELPSGFIEDIVERVRHTERSQLHAAETQTSLQGSDEVLSKEAILPSMQTPPAKPPRQRAGEAVSSPPSSVASERIPHPPRNLDVDTANESTQTLETMTSPPSPSITAFPTAEYLQSLAPLAFYNLRNLESSIDIGPRHRHRPRRTRHSSVSEEDEEDATAATEDHRVERIRRRTRSFTSSDQPQTVAQAGRQFLSACSLSLITVINQLTNSIRRSAEKDQATARTRPALIALFILLTFGILVFLLSGRSIHHHHWDFFNLPGNNGRPT